MYTGQREKNAEYRVYSSELHQRHREPGYKKMLTVVEIGMGIE